FERPRFPCEARIGGAFTMDWNRVQGNWKQVKGKVKEKWGQLTDDDLDVIAGRRDQLEGKLQERYGLAKDQVSRDIDDWYAAQRWCPAQKRKGRYFRPRREPGSCFGLLGCAGRPRQTGPRTRTAPMGPILHRRLARCRRRNRRVTARTNRGTLPCR